MKLRLPLPFAPGSSRPKGSACDLLNAQEEGFAAEGPTGPCVSTEDLSFERLVREKSSPIVDLLEDRRLLGKRIVGRVSDQPSRTRPRVGPGLPDHPCTNWVPEDVANGSDDVFAFEWAGEEPTLEEIAAPAFTEVDHAGVTLVCLTDSLGKTRLRLRDCDEMDVVAHQAPREILNAKPPTLLSQQADVGFTIVVGEEDVHPPDATLSDVVWNFRNDNSRYAGHAKSLA